MPSSREKRVLQQRARRADAQAKVPRNSPEDRERRRKRLAYLHKSHVAASVKAAIICDSEEKKQRLDALVKIALQKFPSLVAYEYRGCLPTFCGMPAHLAEMQKRMPYRSMRDMQKTGVRMS